MLTNKAAKPRTDSRQYEFRFADSAENSIAILTMGFQDRRRRIRAWLCVVWLTVIVAEAVLIWAAITLGVIY
ncbi:hypothetical protein [Undibacter mobilis]|nr:hypothetical protein [Undibacter mobilis]